MVTITTRAAKGSTLTYSEMDGNFTALKAAIEALQDAQGSPPEWATAFYDDFSGLVTGDIGGQNGWIDASGTNAKPQVTADAKLSMRTAVGPSFVYRTGSFTLPRISAIINFGTDCGVSFGWGYTPGAPYFRVEFGAPAARSVTVLYVNASGAETNLFMTAANPSLFSAGVDTSVRITAVATGVRVEVNGSLAVNYVTDNPDHLALIAQAGGVMLRNGQGGVGQRLVDNYRIETS